MNEQQIETACDAYCKICGHYHHTVPPHICRQDCDYYTSFRNELKKKLECRHCRYFVKDRIRLKDGYEGCRIIGYCTFTDPKQPMPANSSVCAYYEPDKQVKV